MKITQNEARGYMREYNDFDAGSLSARTSNFDTHAGALCGETAEQYLKGVFADNILYAIYSYDTPIAWVYADDSNVIQFPEQKYSTTTSTHQNVVKDALKDWEINFLPKDS